MRLNSSTLIFRLSKRAILTLFDMNCFTDILKSNKLINHVIDQYTQGRSFVKVMCMHTGNISPNEWDVYPSKRTVNYFFQTAPVSVPKVKTSNITVTLASRITGVPIVYSTVCSGPDQRTHQSSAPLAFVMGIHRWSAYSPHGVLIVYPPVSSGADQRKIKVPRHWPLWGEFTGDRWQRASNGESASIWWRHHDVFDFQCVFAHR